MTESSSPSSLKQHILANTRYVLLVVLLLAAGAGAFAYLYATKPKPSGVSEPDPGRRVRVFPAEKTTHRIAIRTYGTTQASQKWTAIAEVAGRALKVEPRFEPGEILSAGTLLVRIDPTDYQLAVQRLEAEVRTNREQIAELQQTEANLREIAKLQQRQAELARAEYQREREVYAQNAGSLSSLQAAETTYVANLTALQETRNKLLLVPSQRQRLEAATNAAETQLQQARRDLSECEIRLPLDARCASKAIEENEFVAIGTRLGMFYSLDLAEVVAMVETRKMPTLFPGGIKELGTLDLAAMVDNESIVRQLKVPAAVHWGMGSQPATWYGRVARIASSLDPGTRTMPVTIEVPNPYADVRPGVKPPLVPDVFCEVTIYGATVDNVVVVPREIVRDDRVYLLRDGKLHIAAVTVLAMEEELAVISEGIDEGDLIVLTDLFPANEDMPLVAHKVENPVRPRNNLHFPPGLFDEPPLTAREVGR